MIQTAVTLDELADWAAISGHLAKIDAQRLMPIAGNPPTTS